jgi:glycogen operon protein
MGDEDEIRDISWFRPDGQELSPEDWHDAEGRLLMLRLHGKDAHDRLHSVLVLINATGDEQEFQLPPSSAGWHLLADSADPAREPKLLETTACPVSWRSLVVLADCALTME